MAGTFGIEDTGGLFGNPLDWINSLPAEVKNWIFWILTGCAVAFGLATLISFFYHGTSSQMSAMTKNINARKEHTWAILSGVVTMILVIMAIAFAISIWF
ncbi:MAG: hypothetical protein JXA38_02715 [Methanosarcinaceae archaeon]|nr:hypothetical protein [Methanosarcinaceae archaeon]